MEGDSYGARFRDQLGPAEVLGPEVLDDGTTGRAWSRWLTRTGAVVVSAAAGTALWVGLERPEPPAPEPVATESYGPPITIVRNAPPSRAPLELAAATAELWTTRGFSYDLELTNPTSTAYRVLDIRHAVNGTEMLWNESLVLETHATTTLRVDFLIINCVAVLDRPVPAALRLTLRPEGAAPGLAGGVEIADLDLTELSAELGAAGGVRCADGAASVIGLT